MQLAKGEFGGRVGIWRLIELFDAHGIKATIFTPGRICELYPRALRAAVRSGHEIADHMWEHHVPKESGTRARPSAQDCRRARKDRGRRPVGKRSHHTPGLLKREGFRLQFPRARRITAPTTCWMPTATMRCSNCHSTTRSMTQCSSASPGHAAPTPRNASRTPTACSTCGGRLSAAVPQGGYLNIFLHPFVSGRALRIAMLDRLITRMKRCPASGFPRASRSRSIA